MGFQWSGFSSGNNILEAHKAPPTDLIRPPLWLTKNDIQDLLPTSHNATISEQRDGASEFQVINTHILDIDGFTIQAEEQNTIKITTNEAYVYVLKEGTYLREETEKGEPPSIKIDPTKEPVLFYFPDGEYLYEIISLSHLNKPEKQALLFRKKRTAGEVQNIRGMMV